MCFFFFFPLSKLLYQSEVSHSLKIRSCSDLLCSGAINYSVSHFCLFVLVLGVERLTLVDIEKIIQLHLSHHPLWLKSLRQGTSPDYKTQPDVATGCQAMTQHGFQMSAFTPHKTGSILQCVLNSRANSTKHLCGCVVDLNKLADGVWKYSLNFLCPCPETVVSSTETSCPALFF